MCYKLTQREGRRKEIKFQKHQKLMDDWWWVKLKRGSHVPDNAERSARSHAPCRISKMLKSSEKSGSTEDIRIRMGLDTLKWSGQYGLSQNA